MPHTAMEEGHRTRAHRAAARRQPASLNQLCALPRSGTTNRGELGEVVAVIGVAHEHEAPARRRDAARKRAAIARAPGPAPPGRPPPRWPPASHPCCRCRPPLPRRRYHVRARAHRLAHAAADRRHLVEAGNDHGELERVTAWVMRCGVMAVGWETAERRRCRRDARAPQTSCPPVPGPRRRCLAPGQSPCVCLQKVELAAHGRRSRGPSPSRHEARRPRRHHGSAGATGSRDPRTLSRHVPKARSSAGTRVPRGRGAPGDRDAAPPCDVRGSSSAPRPRPGSSARRCPARPARAKLRRAPSRTTILRTPSPGGAGWTVRRGRPAAGLRRRPRGQRPHSPGTACARRAALPVGSTRLLTGKIAMATQRHRA